MRPVALGRKNWIHLGSQEAGPKIAAILSILETCRRLQIPARKYLAAVLPGLAGVYREAARRPPPVRRNLFILGRIARLPSIHFCITLYRAF